MTRIETNLWILSPFYFFADILPNMTGKYVKIVNREYSE